jgi:hypothetical protein
MKTMEEFKDYQLDNPKADVAADAYIASDKPFNYIELKTIEGIPPEMMPKAE